MGVKRDYSKCREGRGKCRRRKEKERKREKRRWIILRKVISNFEVPNPAKHVSSYVA